MPRSWIAVACLLATTALGGCATSADRAGDDPSSSISTLGHSPFTDHEYGVAVATARAEVGIESAVLTSATATIGDGTVSNPNYGPPCTSGKLFHIKLIGEFPRMVPRALGDQPTPRVMTPRAVQLTADAASGKPCMLSVEMQEAGTLSTSSPDPGAVLLFTH